MRSVASVLRLPGQVLALSRWGQACGGLAAHSRQLSSDSKDEDLAAHGVYVSSGFDAAEEGAPLAVHQLIGDPRTGVADDTTTTPWGADVSMEWVWSSPESGVDWFRYSMAGPDQLPHMYMDSRLSDHSKNLMYLLRCKDPQRWTIPALAEKFRIRRQRVMAILALKEMQAHRLEQGQDMKGPLQPYTFKVPLQDFHVQPDGQPVDLAQLLAQQQQLQAAAAASSSSSSSMDTSTSAAAADGLGSLEDFLAPDGGSSGAAAAMQPDALSSLSAAAGGQAADLAVLMPQLALTAQQLQLELLQLLQQHHYSIDELQRRLLQQVDVAEAYYNAHIAGTPLEQQLLASFIAPKKAAAAKEGSEEADDAAAAAVARPAWLDFDKQRQEVQQLLGVLAPLLQAAGHEQDRETGRLLAALKHALHEATAAPAPAAAAEGEASAEQQQQLPEAGSGAAAGIAALVKSAEAATFAAAFNQLDVSRRQQLLDIMPEARILLNVQGTDLRAALASSSSSSEAADGAATSLAAAAAAPAPALWPGQVPPVVDVWNYEEVPKQQLAALQKQVGPLQQLLGQLQAACAGLGGSSSSSSAEALEASDMQALQRAAQVYSGLVWEYDKVLGEQAAAATGQDEGTAPLPASSQRRLMRILRELDANALEKLLLWESYFREESWEGRDSPRARRLLRRVHAAIKALDAQAAARGLPTPFAEYPDLPSDVAAHLRVDKDMATAHLDAEVVGRQFHRGSGDRHYVRVKSYPAFEGYSLQEFDKIQEGELSTLSRLAAEREDSMMWKEFRERLLRNIGLTAPDLYQHVNKARPPRPRKGWSYVVHPMGGDARKLIKQQLRQQKVQQWLDDDAAAGSIGLARPGDLGLALDPARDAAPAEPYVAVPGKSKPKIRGLNEEEAVVVGYSRAKPRRRWYASMRSRVL